MDQSFPYTERAREAETARLALHASSKTSRQRRDSQSTRKNLDAIARFRTAMSSVYPPNFWLDIEKLRRGDSAYSETAIAFLEADPMFYRSGYDKSKVIRCIKRVPLTPPQIDRLRSVVLRVIRSHDRREFRHFCRLAKPLDGISFRATLREMIGGIDAGIARRARWVLGALEGPSSL